MYLTREEEKILDGEYGYGYKKAMEILVAIGKIYEADRLIDISSAHISGVSYKNIGDEGVEFLKEMAKNSRVRVPTTINPGGFDLNNWKRMNIDRRFIEKQMDVINTFQAMGIKPSLSCTPYYNDNLPNRGEHVAWAESSAVTLVNSLIGAYTNRESGISALAAALLGKTPRYGLHTYEGRMPKYTIKLKTRLNKMSEYGVLGYLISDIIGNNIPYIKGIKNSDIDKMKYLAASLATYAGTPMFHIEGLTPEYMEYEPPKEKISIDEEDISKGFKRLRDVVNSVDMVWIGCPHASISEIKTISNLVKGKSLKKKLVVTTARSTYKLAVQQGFIDEIENAGGEVYADTCIIVSPIGEKIRSIMTNSAKAFYYLRGVNNIPVYVADLEECIETALTGE